MHRDIRLLHDPFVPGELTEPFARICSDAGGICTFIGEVRREADVEALELSHYEPLTLPGLDQLADKASKRFDLLGLLIVHRVGTMGPGEPIVCVSAASRHRRDAIDAVDFCMDHLKSAAWFWKRELSGGNWRWIEPRSADYADLARWN
ncbi:molybdenum cofactor biosynthesis protein MoaE [Erythrobacter insulae]|uniref:Molybdopterin synthase catalytic subunit n=1 Tax=Erythrobacter insulae TaxID=2584124 RepID=A0A547P8Z9_9SPHN|nr:molybdenum cofactor biosynthesis protein MoaE [Erythrobacter insulae]TRD10534.1 molybdenum cofactor biosynthesis protein MoaE [Erythrobacter insulae]